MGTVARVEMEKPEGDSFWPSEDIFPPILYEAALQALKTGELKHGVGTLYEHLVGTARILRAWGQPERVVIAGMFHSIYSTPSFKTQAVSYAQRGNMQAILGSEPEQLVYLFSLIKPQDVEKLLREESDKDEESLLTLRCTPEAGKTEREIILPKRIVYDLEIIHLANTLDQAKDSRCGPDQCLSRVSEGAALLPRQLFPFPKTLLQLLLPLSPHQEMHLLDAYEDLIARFAKSLTFSDELGRCTELVIDLPELLFWGSLHADAQGKPDLARSLARRSREAFLARGCAWDKRLAFDEWVAMSAALMCGGLDNLQIDSLRARFNRQDEVNEDVDKIRRVYRYLVRTGDAKSSRPAGWYPGLTAQPFHDKTQFSIASLLEENFPAILEEVLRLEQSVFHSEAENIDRTGRWEVMILFESGRIKEENCAKVPRLAELLKNSPEVRTSAGLIYLSRVKAGTKIAAHRGGSNLRLRLHLGIIIPEGDCKLRVSREVVTWTTGKCMVFDDFYEHEVWNNTDEDRLVLVVDLWHPDLSIAERRALEAMNVQIARQARGRQRYWATNEQQKIREQSSAGSKPPTD